MTTHIENRMIEWACWRLEPALDFTPSQTVMQRIKEEQHNAGAGDRGFRYEIIKGVPCKPDGGVGAMVERMASELARDRRCREIEELLPFMPNELVLVIRATYVCVHWRDIPRSERDAADAMKVKQGKYRELKARLIGWVEARICFPHPPAKAAA